MKHGLRFPFSLRRRVTALAVAVAVLTATAAMPFVVNAQTYSPTITVGNITVVVGNDGSVMVTSGGNGVMFGQDGHATSCGFNTIAPQPHWNCTGGELW